MPRTAGRSDGRIADCLILILAAQVVQCVQVASLRRPSLRAAAVAGRGRLAAERRNLPAACLPGMMMHASRITDDLKSFIL